MGQIRILRIFKISPRRRNLGIGKEFYLINNRVKCLKEIIFGIVKTLGEVFDLYDLII